MRSGARSLRGVKAPHVGDGASRWRRSARRSSARSAASNSCVRHLQAAPAARRRIARVKASSAASPSPRTASMMRARRSGNGRRRRAAPGAASAARCCAGDRAFQSRMRMRIAARPASSRPAAPARSVAPALFRLSSVSQNTFSRHTACTATRSPRPSSGMTVGDSLPGSSLAIAAQRRARRVQHDVLAALDLFHAVDAHQQALGPLLLLARRSAPACGSAPPGSRARSRLPQMIGRQRRAGRDQIADQIGAPEPRRDLHRHRTAPRPRRAMPRSREEARQDVRIGGGDALALRATARRGSRSRPAPRCTAGSVRSRAAAPSRTAARCRAPANARRFSSTTLRPTRPRSQTSSCTRSGMSSSRTNSTSSGMFSP